ncbi:hypothetical protein M9H77_10711 [Catharanthus roseus]|uniref:Uncharacterized protein n=1 Tax=Catharanthus roseus TaxID=4058 RepID=A0ACC0BCM2_CATRO|nr:hypothetical protein M9H77_10711 [Catharanthus roseus]
METSSSDAHANSSSTSNSTPSSPRDSNSLQNRSYGIQFPPPLRFFRSPVSSLLEYSGLLRLRPDQSEAEPLVRGNNSNNNNGRNTISNPTVSVSRSGSSHNSSTSSNASSNGEVSIRIIGAGERDRLGSEDGDDDDDEGMRLGLNSVEEGAQERNLGTTSASVDSVGEGSVGGGSSSNGRGESSYQRYDIQQFARWIEQILPFFLLLLVVFIRQHLQGFFVTIWISAFMFKSNDILRKQTALKGERKIFVLAGYFVVFMLHVLGIYWWYRNDDLYYPLFMVPPKSIPPFWHAVFIILVNDTMVRQAAMSLKLLLLMYYKNGRGHNFRRQGQMLTLVEYTLLLYRALLPTPVWYRFFLNKEYGSLFSSLTTGLYLTFKLTSIVEKVQSFLAALKALSRTEIHYGSYATAEQKSRLSRIECIFSFSSLVLVTFSFSGVHIPLILAKRRKFHILSYSISVAVFHLLDYLVLVLIQKCHTQYFWLTYEFQEIWHVALSFSFVNAAGDLCAICQEKMHAPILLRCKHIFCEDCVSEWFERERTCPLCRALVRPADLRSFGDGSTSLFIQVF